MTLIKSISGIRGTIGGIPGDSLTPLDVVRFTSAYAIQLKNKHKKQRNSVVIGRDARISGEMVSALVSGTLTGMGIDVIDLGFATTPTVELGVTHHKADGGIILTASHNPGQWNALKLLNAKGEFLSAEDGAEILAIAASEKFEYSPVEQLGKITLFNEMNDIHISAVLRMKYADPDSIKKARFKVVIDCVNSVGGIILPALFRKLGVEVIELYCEPTGKFPHNPEPLPQNLGDIARAVVDHHADLGFVVDPDVDRLVIVNEDGSMFGEEYTLVAVADYILKNQSGNTV